MKKRLWSNRKDLIRALVVLAFLISFAEMGRAQTTTFNYQGSLKDGGAAANGSFQMQFKLYDSLSGGGQIGSTITDIPVTVTQGIFGVSLDFGSNALGGANRWLEIAVRHNSSESYVTLAPRNQIASSPYSVRTLSAASADGLSSNCVGCVQDSNINSLSGAKVTGTVSNASNAINAATSTNSSQLNGQTGSFYQNAANLSSGTIPDLRLSSNVALLNTVQTFSAAKTFSAPSVFNGTVGIGTASPLRALSIVGGLEVDQGNQNGSDVNTFGINFGLGSGSGIASNRSGAGANPNGLNFYASDSGSPKMALTAAGQLGIGTSTPFAMLHVNGTAFVSDTVTSGSFIGSGSSLTSLNASSLSSGTLADGRLAGTYTSALTLSNTGNSFTGTFTGSGSGFTGSGAGLTNLNASNISSGTLNNARLGVVPIANGGTGSATQNFVDLTTPQIIGGNKTFSAATTFNGNVGIGTASPGERLEIDAPDATVRVRNINDSGGGYMQNSFSTLQLGMFNPSASAIGQVPAGGKRAFFAVGSDGRVGSTTNLNSGNPIYRNLLDDGSGNVSISGNISSAGSISSSNFPRAKVVETYRDVRNPNAGILVVSGQSPNIDSITVTIPSSGLLMLRGTIQLYNDASAADPRADAYFKLSDNTASPVTLCETDWGYDTGGSSLIVTQFLATLTVEWTVNVNAGTRTYGTSLFNQGGAHLIYYSTSLQAIFIPSGL